MFRSAVIAVVAAAALVAPSVPVAGADVPARAATKVTGKWRGVVGDDPNAADSYVAKVRIFRRDGVLKGRINYPAYECSGRWKFNKKRNGWFRFREIITKDPGEMSCLSRIPVKAKRDGRRLVVVWKDPSTGQTAHMRARRV